MKRPNILFAIADDASHMSAYGHKFVHTPNFDKVARDGVLFTNAFTTNPKCAPSRASILASMHTWQMEEACNHFGIFPAKFAVFPDLLEQSGYFVGFTGKGWGPGDYERGGFTRNPAGPEYNRRTLEPPADTGINRRDYTANFTDFLTERPQGQPFYFWYGGHEPHRKYVEGEGMRAGKTLDQAELPSYLPDDDIVKSDLLDYAYEIEWFDRHLGLMLNELEKIGELDNTIVVVTSDNGMPFPRVKGQMYEQDFHLPLAICWKDNATGGRVVDDLVSFTDYAPTFLEAAGVPAHPQMVGRSLLGIMKSGQSGRVEAARDRAFMGKERHDVGTEGDVSYPVRCIRTEQYLYVRNFKPELWPAGNPETGYPNVDGSPTKTLVLEQHDQGNDHYFNLSFGKRTQEELFDIVSDPECVNNLADKAEFAALKESLWSELRAKLEETRDPRLLGGGDAFDAYEYVGKAPHSWAKYLASKSRSE